MNELEQSKKTDFDKFVDEIQQQIIEDERAIFSEKVIAEYHNPYNIRRMDDPDGSAVNHGSCGDTMEFYLKVSENTLIEVTFITDGCGSSIACGSKLTRMVDGKTIEEAEVVDRKKLIEALDGLPPENLHCAKLAVDTLRMAIANYREKG